MTIKEKIQQAKELVAKLEGIKDPTTNRNDAANIFAESFDEYMTIWDALQEVPCEIVLDDHIPGQVIEPKSFPEVEIPEDFSI